MVGGWVGGVGEGNLGSRMGTADGLVNTNDGHLEVPTVEFMGNVWNLANYDFVDVCMVAVRRIISIAPPVAKRGKIARSTWMPRDDGASLRHFADTFSLGPKTGIRQSIISHEAERKMESETIKSSIGKSKPELPSGGPRTRWGKEISAYPAGTRFRTNGQEDARKNAPLINSSGKQFRLDYNSHDGRHIADSRNAREKR